MIRSFRHKGVEKFFLTGSKAGIQPHHAKRLRRQLSSLNEAIRPEMMNAPGWKLHSLSGEFEGHWAITVNANWRLTFSFEGSDEPISRVTRRALWPA